MNEQASSVFDRPTREIEIDGVVSVSESMSADDFHSLFIAWVEEKGFAFGGSVGPCVEEE